MYPSDKCILEQLNKYIMMDENEAKQKEDLMIGLIKKYESEKENILFGDSTIIKYFLMYLRKVKKEIWSHAWIWILEGAFIDKNFIQFLKDNNVWNDYTAQLLLISDKNNIKCGENESQANWLEAESVINLEHDEAWDKEYIKTIDEVFICYEWDNLRNTPEWNQVDISTCKSSDNLTGIALMKYLDSKITREHIINRLMYYFYDEEYEVKKYSYEIFLDNKNKPRIRKSFRALLLKGKQYEDEMPFYVFKEDVDEELSTKDIRVLTPTDVKIVTISKENNIKKLTIETNEGYTVHMLYDELPRHITKELFINNLISLVNDEEKVIKKRIIENYKVCAEFNPFTNSIITPPFLLDNKNAKSCDTLYNSKECERYNMRYPLYKDVPVAKNFLFEINKVNYNKNTKEIQLTLDLSEGEMDIFKIWACKENWLSFGELQIKRNSIILTLNELYSSLAYNVLEEADGKKDIFELLKNNNYIQLYFLSMDEISDQPTDLKYILFSYEPKMF